MGRTMEERFWSKVEMGSDLECWPWIACTVSGYGQFSLGNRNVPAHRLAYELLIGPIPDGLVLDHLCRNKACCNPAHLDAVTQRENVLRGEGFAARNVKLTHCAQGHEFTSENIQWIGTTRRCRICSRRTSRVAKARRREAARNG